MQKLRFTVAAMVLGFSSLAAADMNSVAEILAKNSHAGFEVTTKTNKDPITVDVMVNGKTLESAQGTPEDFINAVRSKVPARTIKSQEFTYILEWQKISVPMNSSTLAISDLLNDIKDHQAEPGDSDMSGYLSQHVTPLSIVGPYVSYRSEGDDFYPGAAHPNNWEYFTAVDVRSLTSDATGYNPANLLDIVEEASLVAALQADKALAKLLEPSARKKFLAAKTLEQLADAADFNMKSCYSFPAYENRISTFALYDYDPIRKLVSVRVSMGAAAHVCTAEAPTIQLGLLVRPLQDLEYRLGDQLKTGEGLLMKQVSGN